MYFDYKDRANQTVSHVLGSLLRQVISHLDHIPLELSKFYDRSNTPLNRDVLLAQFISACSQFDVIYVVFDGFDECDEIQQNEIQIVINELLSRPRLKLLVTSRPHLKKLRSLADSSSFMSITAKDEDVRMYLSSRLHKIGYLSQIVKNEAVEVISQSAQGMYNRH